jgi:uncharacterized protein YneF (UPF0154 family)
MENLPHNSVQSPSILRKLAALVVTLVLLGLALVFSVLVLAVVLTAGAIALGYFWWRTRELRKQMRDHPPGGVVIEGEVIQSEIIEGEVIRDDESRDGK